MSTIASHCIPINRIFVKHLTKTCEQYGNIDSDIEVDHEGSLGRRLVAGHHRRASIVDQLMFDSDTKEEPKSGATTQDAVRTPPDRRVHTPTEDQAEPRSSEEEMVSNSPPQVFHTPGYSNDQQTRPHNDKDYGAQLSERCRKVTRKTGASPLLTL